jgi:plasmid stabilization system protein ParE
VNYSLQLRPELIDDAHEAFAWYESAATGLGHEFLRCYFAAVAVAQREPLLFRKVHRDFRRVLLDRFPYALYFRVELRTVVIFLLIHGARNPALIRRALRGRGERKP